MEIFLRLKKKVYNSRELLVEVPLENPKKPNFKFSQNINILKQLYQINKINKC